MREKIISLIPPRDLKRKKEETNHSVSDSDSSKPREALPECMSEEERIDIAAKNILELYRPAFEELAK